MGALRLGGKFVGEFALASLTFYIETYRTHFTHREHILHSNIQNTFY